jgi:hypothetical protein
MIVMPSRRPTQKPLCDGQFNEIGRRMRATTTLTRTGTLTDGKVSVMNVAREAGFSRATAYRCAEIRAKFDRVRKSGAVKPKASAQSDNRDLRTAVQQLLSRIIVLDAVLKERDSEIVRLRVLLKSSVR